MNFQLYKERMIPLLMAHNPQKFDVFPQNLVEGVASAIIIGYDFQDQLHNDAFMIHELKVKLEKQLRADFEVLRSNVKAVAEVNC
ncbi:hypothetical protein TELCIR_14421 [Teladorsagia circumcincta]|uniref:Uncharacterized protein n=1 Tax=Teladorsagia circumcincta TaxID=45464 RepID=A0A2G9U163_TELCI|nr:hypothetical protein TELCIR_14421 [Teladorsagia circumcincta]